MNYLLQNGDAHLKNFGLLYKGISDINLAPAYDVVCTTAYIERDIPALHLLGSKKWWSKKFLLQFGVKYCDLSNAEVNKHFECCVSSIKFILNIMKHRVANETNQDKLEVLNKMISTNMKIKRSNDLEKIDSNQNIDISVNCDNCNKFNGNSSDLKLVVIKKNNLSSTFPIGK